MITRSISQSQKLQEEIAELRNDILHNSQRKVDFYSPSSERRNSTGIYYPTSTLRSPIQYIYPDLGPVSELDLPHFSEPLPPTMIQNNNSNRDQSTHSTQEHNITFNNSVDRLTHTYSQFSYNNDRLATNLQRQVETQDIIHTKFFDKISEVNSRINDIQHNLSSRRHSPPHIDDEHSEATFIQNNNLSKNRKKADYFATPIIKNWQPKLYQPLPTQPRVKTPCSLEIIHKVGLYIGQIMHHSDPQIFS